MPRNNEDFEYAFSQGGSNLPHVLQVSKGDAPIAHLQWEPEKGQISDVHVEEPYRRQGIATSMWDKAHQWSKANKVTAPIHNPKRTDSGDSWAKSVGDKLPEKEPYERHD
jgi:GNAT superfamily N-acetyltransferase